jgi:hypothetical protein
VIYMLLVEVGGGELEDMIIREIIQVTVDLL